MTWWPTLGEPSLLAGAGLGFTWAMWTTAQRRRKFLHVATPPVGQVRWFLLNFFSMSSYLTLVFALGLASVHDLLPPSLLWFLLAASSMAFMSASLFATMQIPRLAATAPSQAQEPPSAPPLMPIQRSA